MEEKRDSSQPDSPPHAALSSYIKPQARKPHDSNVTFEEYYWYAQRTREEEKGLEAPRLQWREVLLRKKNAPDAQHGYVDIIDSEKFHSAESRLQITDEEWTDASRAFRTASWGACEHSVHCETNCIVD
jgi:hypothetical protein